MKLEQHQFHNESLELIKEVMSTTDIYHIENLKTQNLVDKTGTYKSPRNLSISWLHDSNGLMSSLDRYDTFDKRIHELYSTGDYIKRLRQRLAMVHEMISCKLRPNLPVHISCTPRVRLDKNFDKPVLDLEDPNIGEYFNFEIHPGQTRAQASTFLRHRLHNVLLYINKGQTTHFDFKINPWIKKIETVEELLDVYNFSFPEHETRPKEEIIKHPSFKVNFNLQNKLHPGNKPLKYHRTTNTTVLKCVDMGILNEQDERMAISYHSTGHYVSDSFLIMDKFCDIVFNSPFNIYSDDTSKAEASHREGANYILFGEQLDKKELRHHCFTPYKAMLINEYIERPKPGNFLTPELFTYMKSKLTLDKYNEFVHTAKTLDTIGKNPFFNLNPIYKQVTREELTDYQKLVEYNSYKGFCIFHDSDIENFYRNIYELLFCIPASHSITKTEDGRLGIINCQHEYWKTGQNYTEFILNNTFYDTKTFF